MRLLTVEDARARMLAAVGHLDAEDVPLAQALSRVLAQDVTARRDQPPFSASAMDGWAVRAADAPGRLKIVGESAAGRGYTGALKPGEAVRIFTGAAVPAGADCVVIQEDAQRDGHFVTIPAVTDPRNIRATGIDFKAGDQLLSKGVRLDPWRLSLAAASGLGTLAVSRQPRIAILSTGEEVVEPGGEPGPFQIFNSGTTALSALVGTWGGLANPLGVVGDDEKSIARSVAKVGCDMIVTLGGASVGDHDMVKPALGRLGLELVVESVAVRPGKPTWFGLLGDGRRVLGLPGNPASALVCAELFLKPLISAYQGADHDVHLVKARSSGALPANGQREHWMRARLSHAADGALVAEAFRDQDSSLVSVFASADALLRRSIGASAVSPGDPVEVLPLARA
jgi:molybdopterin molybdotransferase